MQRTLLKKRTGERGRREHLGGGGEGESDKATSGKVPKKTRPRRYLGIRTFLLKTDKTKIELTKKMELILIRIQ